MRQAQALLDSMVEMLWQARAPGGPAIVCVEGTRPYVGRSGAYRPDGFTEKLLKYEARTKEDLEKLIRSQLPVVRGWGWDGRACGGGGGGGGRHMPHLEIGLLTCSLLRDRPPCSDVACVHASLSS